MVKNTNDGSGDAPQLKAYLNLGTLDDLRSASVWPGLQGRALIERLRNDGFEGIQPTDVPFTANAAHPLRVCVADRIDTAADALAIVAKHADQGRDCLTVHAGSGLEDDDAAFRLVEAILESSHTFALPTYIETHRATITQDLWRTVQIVKRFPEVRFNGDFSHYYTGQELVYGGLERKLDFMAPIFERVRFLHARIGSPGCIQVSIGHGESRPPQAHGPVDFIADFKELWTRAMQGFLRTARPGDYLIFCPELLSGTYYYARKFPDAQGRLIEESDRYREALLYQKIARDCFAEAIRRNDALRPR